MICLGDLELDIASRTLKFKHCFLWGKWLKCFPMVQVHYLDFISSKSQCLPVKHHSESKFEVNMVNALSPAQTLQVIDLRLTCNWTFELLAIACNKSFNMLNILLAIL